MDIGKRNTELLQDFAEIEKECYALLNFLAQAKMPSLMFTLRTMQEPSTGLSTIF